MKETIKEILVALGFKIEEQDLGMLGEIIAEAAWKVMSLGTAATAAVLAVEAAMNGSAARMEDFRPAARTMDNVVHPVRGQDRASGRIEGGAVGAGERPVHIPVIPLAGIPADAIPPSLGRAGEFLLSGLDRLGQAKSGWGGSLLTLVAAWQMPVLGDRSVDEVQFFGPAITTLDKTGSKSPTGRTSRMSEIPAIPGHSGKDLPDRGGQLRVRLDAVVDGLKEKRAWIEDRAGKVGNSAVEFREILIRRLEGATAGKALAPGQWLLDPQVGRNSAVEQHLAVIHRHLVIGVERASGAVAGMTGKVQEAGATLSRLHDRSADGIGPALSREFAADGWFGHAKLTPAPMAISTSQALQANRTATITQKTDIHVTAGRDPAGTAQAVAREQGRVNADLLRNMTGALR